LQSYLGDIVVLIDSYLKVVEHPKQIILAGNKYALEHDVFSE